MEAVVTAITNMGTSIANTGLDVIANVLPVVAPLTAAVVVANLGRKVILRFVR